jgi:CheY-like chemotaxis protein
VRVLVTEDDEVLATAVAAGLRREGMAVDVALDGAAALERVAVSRYDVVVLDRDLPGVPGDDVCRALAGGRSESRVLMLTAARSVQERVEGLGLGADDYLPKPFGFAELVARIRALGRRAAAPLPASLEHGDLNLDPARRVAVRAGRPARAARSSPSRWHRVPPGRLTWPSANAAKDRSSWLRTADGWTGTALRGSSDGWPNGPVSPSRSGRTPSATHSSPPRWTPVSRCGMFRKLPRTPTRVPLCGTTGHAPR